MKFSNSNIINLDHNLKKFTFFSQNCESNYQNIQIYKKKNIAYTPYISQCKLNRAPFNNRPFQTAKSTQKPPRSMPNKRRTPPLQPCHSPTPYNTFPSPAKIAFRTALERRRGFCTSAETMASDHETSPTDMCE